MIVLGLDTCLNACSVAVLDGDRVVAHRSEVMARGHQERLAPMAKAVMEDAGLPFSSLERIAVTVGPGSFTGLRVGVAFAKGLASALGISAAPVGVLEALAAECAGRVGAAVDARRDQVYLQVFDAGRPLMAPDVVPTSVAAERLAELSPSPSALVGSGAPLLMAAAPGAAILTPEGCDARKVAILGAARAAGPLVPLYLRAPDAKLPGGRSPP